MKNFIKNNIIAVITALIIVGGIGGVAVYSAQGSDNMKVIYDQEGKIKDIVPADKETTSPTVAIDKNQFNAIEAKGRADFEVKNGQVTELTQPKPKNKYMVQFDPNTGELVGAPVENTGNATENYVELPDKLYEDIKHGSKYKMVNGRLGKEVPNTNVTAEKGKLNADGSRPPIYITPVK